MEYTAAVGESIIDVRAEMIKLAYLGWYAIGHMDIFEYDDGPKYIQPMQKSTLN